MISKYLSSGSVFVIGGLLFLSPLGASASEYGEESEVEEEPMGDESFDDRPFGQHSMELGLGIGAGGFGDYFSISIGGSFDYYVVQRLAPGLMLTYTAMWGDKKYPQSLMTMPFLKFVLIRSRTFAPYLMAGGGRMFEWAGTSDPLKGYAAVSSWLVGGGVGAHVGLSRNFGLNILILVMYQKFDEEVLLAGTSNTTDHRVTPMWSFGFSFGF